MSETATTPKRRKKVEQTAEPVSRQEVVVHLPLSELHPMPDAPYGVRDDEAMRSTVRSIKENGVLTPAIVRPRADGGYEIIAGNRRKHGAELADLATIHHDALPPARYAESPRLGALRLLGFAVW